MISGPPDAPVTMPDALRGYVRDNPFEFVWLNSIGGLTVRIGDPGSCVYVKWSPRDSGVDLAGEVARLAWAADYTRVPTVLDAGADSEGSWFVSRGIDAESAVSPRWKRDPLTATTAVGEGLRALHDRLDVSACPFEWSREHRLRNVERKVAEGRVEHHDFDWGVTRENVSSVLDELRVAPKEDLVVCHGDACAPNTLIDDSGAWVAHVDLGSLGVGDRFADLAIAAGSAVWNYGPEWENNVYEAYGVEPDYAKVRYYRLMWSLD